VFIFNWWCASLQSGAHFFIEIVIFGTDFVVYCGEWFWKKIRKKNHWKLKIGTIVAIIE